MPLETINREKASLERRSCAQFCVPTYISSAICAATHHASDQPILHPFGSSSHGALDAFDPVRDIQTNVQQHGCRSIVPLHCPIPAERVSDEAV